MEQAANSQVAEQAKGHLEAFLGIMVVPIPALLVLGQAVLTGGDQIRVFDLELSVRAASRIVGATVVLLLLAAMRSLGAIPALAEQH